MPWNKNVADIVTPFSNGRYSEYSFTFTDVSGNGSLDLVWIKEQDNNSGKLELLVAGKQSGYEKLTNTITTGHEYKDSGYWFLRKVGSDTRPTLIFVQVWRTNSGEVEVNFSSASNNYHDFQAKYTTCWPCQDYGRWDISDKGDLVHIDQRSVAGNVEVHITSFASLYQKYDVQKATIWSKEDARENVLFMDARSSPNFPNLYHLEGRALYAQIVAVSSSSDYQQKVLDESADTGMQPSGLWFMSYLGQGYSVPDLVYVRTNGTDSGKVEMRVRAYT